MKKQPLLYGVIGLLAGIVITGFAAGQAVNSNATSVMRMMGMDTSKTQQQTTPANGTMSMADMNEQLGNLSGDDFDKAFLEMMIVHHQGAIDMATLANTRAINEEIKLLSQDIISAQTKEIAEMQKWQMDWGYKTSTDSMPGMNH